MKSAQVEVGPHGREAQPEFGGGGGEYPAFTGTTPKHAEPIVLSTDWKTDSANW